MNNMVTTGDIVLASGSVVRQRLMRDAGINFTVKPAAIDEQMVKESLLAEGADATQLAHSLAELKAYTVSRRCPGVLVIGADQILVCGDRFFDKPVDMDHARAHLQALRNRSHDLVSAVCAVRDGVPLWHEVSSARLTLRDFSDQFLDEYLAAAGDQILSSVGAYQLEGAGVHLFSKIEGDYFTILGLPLLPLLLFLRDNGVLKT